MGRTGIFHDIVSQNRVVFWPDMVLNYCILCKPLYDSHCVLECKIINIIVNKLFYFCII